MQTVSETPFLRSFAIQARVLGALVMREVFTRWGRHNIGFLWIFFGPMLVTLAVTLVWNVVRGFGYKMQDPTLISVLAITGYSSQFSWRNTPGSCGSVLNANRNLLYHRNVRIIDLYFSKILVEASGLTLSLLITTLVFVFAGIIRPPADILTAFYGWVLTIWFGSALSLMVGSIITMFSSLAKVWLALTHMLFPIAGVANMVAWIPPAYRQILLWSPMVNNVELLRKGYLGETAHCYFDIAYSVSINLCMTFIGLVLVSRLRSPFESE